MDLEGNDLGWQYGTGQSFAQAFGAWAMTQVHGKVTSPA